MAHEALIEVGEVSERRSHTHALVRHWMCKALQRDGCGALGHETSGLGRIKRNGTERREGEERVQQRRKRHFLKQRRRQKGTHHEA